MERSITRLADQLISAGGGGLKDIRIHAFDDDAAAQDKRAMERLYAEFSAELNRAVVELSKVYGNPVRTGSEEDEAIPLNGVFKFSVWDVEGTELFIAASHEDREVPILLMLGTA